MGEQQSEAKVFKQWGVLGVCGGTLGGTVRPRLDLLGDRDGAPPHTALL